MEPYPLPYEDIPANQIYMSKDVRKFGMLKKKSGGVKIPLFQDKYDLRFVIIHKGWVYYYKDKSSEKPQNKFSLQGFSNTVINAEEEEGSHAFVFKIYSMKATERTWYFATETELDMEQWMEAFRLEIAQYNVRGISKIRTSKSCPEKPGPGSFGMCLPDRNNVRPQSMHTAPPTHVDLPESQFSSHSDLTSGIGSMQSIDPDYNYEPVEDYDPDTEFDTDDSEYEEPATDVRQSFHPQLSCETLDVKTASFDPSYPTRHPNIFSQDRQSFSVQKYEPPPVVPPRDPVIALSIAQQNPFPQRNPIFKELEDKMNPRSGHHPTHEPVQTPNVSSPSFGSGVVGRRHQYPLPEPTPSPPFHSPPAFTTSSQNQRDIFPSSQFSPPPRPPTFHKSGFSCGHPRDSNAPVHLRQRSEDPKNNREHTVSSSERLKRHSSPFTQMHEKLSEQLASKLGQSTSPSIERNARQRPWSMAPITPDNREVGSPSYRQQLSPLDRMALQPLPELQDSAKDRPTDLPSRPPPLPPGPKSGKISFPTGPTGLPSPDHRSNNTEPHMQSPVFSVSNKPVGHRLPIGQSKFPGFPTQPPLPPKPGVSRTPMPGFEQHDEYVDTGHMPDNYDDNVDDGGVYDLPEEQEPYEQTYPNCEQIGEAIYEEEENINNKRPFQVKPVKDQNPLPPLLPAKPKANHKHEIGKSWQSHPKSPVSVVSENTSGPAWQVKLKPTTSRPADLSEKNRAWAQPLGSTDNPGVLVQTTSPASAATYRPSCPRVETAAPKTPPPETPPKPSCVKQGQVVSAQKPPLATKKTWQKDLARSNRSSAEASVSNSGTRGRPPVSQKPKPAVSSKSILSHSNRPGNSKPPPPLPKPQSAGSHISDFAKLRGKFSN